MQHKVLHVMFRGAQLYEEAVVVQWLVRRSPRRGYANEAEVVGSSPIVGIGYSFSRWLCKSLGHSVGKIVDYILSILTILIPI